MRINKSLTLTVILLMLTQFVIGQIVAEKEIRGKISVDSSSIEGINVVNSSNEKATVSDKNGMFSLLIKEGDVLIFSAVNLDAFRKKINKQDLISDVIRVQMNPKSIVLKEVVINEYPNITAENLGIIPYGQKKYTPAERKLKTAGDFKPIMLLNLIGGSMPLDPLINKINGRTKRLKNEVVLERRELNLRFISALFNEDFFIEKLKIPEGYVGGFKYYILEDKNFVSNLNTNNKPMLEFLISELATKYNDIIACENK